jgi:hypothetical protein
MAQASSSTEAGAESGGEDSHSSDENYFQRWLVDPAQGKLTAVLTQCLQGITTAVALSSSQANIVKHIRKEGRRLTAVQQSVVAHAVAKFKTQLQGGAAEGVGLGLVSSVEKDLKVEGIKGGRTNPGKTSFSFRCKIREDGKNRSISAKWCAIRLRTLRLRA